MGILTAKDRRDNFRIYYCEKCDWVRFPTKTYSVRKCKVCGGELNKVEYYGHIT